MKKQMKWLLAALALAALATPAFAINADMTGTIGVRAIATNNFDGNDDIQDHAKWVDQRLRLFTSVAANENVRGVLGLEVDNVWGRVATPAVKEVGAVGADAGVGPTAVIEIKHLYLDFKIPSLGTNVKAGTQPFNFGRGLVINDDAAGLLITQPCPAFPDNKLELSWIKTSEGNTVEAANADDEGDFYGAKYTMKVAGIAIAPYAGYYQNDFVSTSTFNDGVEAAFFGVDVDGKAGPFGYAATALYNNWSNGAADGDSISLYGKGTLDLGATNLSLEAGRYGDKDNQGGNAMSLAQSAANGPLQNISEILTGGMYTHNSAGVANVKGAGTLYLTNWLYAKAGVAQKLSDSMKVSAYVAHIQQGADVGTTDKITFGQEVDAYFDYTIVPGLGLNLMGAYLLADDDFGDDNAWKLATSLNYKF
jgi:hypothetical protein